MWKTEKITTNISNEIGTYNCRRHPRQAAWKAGSRRLKRFVAPGDSLKQDNVHNWTLKNRIPSTSEINASGRHWKRNSKSDTRACISVSNRRNQYIKLKQTCILHTSVTNLQYCVHIPTYIYNLGMKSTSKLKRMECYKCKKIVCKYHHKNVVEDQTLGILNKRTLNRYLKLRCLIIRVKKR